MAFIHEIIIMLLIFSLSDFNPSKTKTLILPINNKSIYTIYQKKNIDTYLQKTKISIIFNKNKALLKNKNIKKYC